MFYYVTNKPFKIFQSTIDRLMKVADANLDIPNDVEVEICFSAAGTGKFFGGICNQIEHDSSEYQVLINPKMTIHMMIITILHEMVHVDQYSSNKLVHTELGHFRWNDLDYEDAVYSRELPWEKEAYEKEKTLYKNYISQSGFFHQR